MTALDAALAQLSKVMGGRPYALVYDSSHPESEVSHLKVSAGGDKMTVLGLLVWGRAQMLRGLRATRPDD